MLAHSLGYADCKGMTETITLPSQGHESIFENPVPILAKTREFFVAPENMSPENTVETQSKMTV